MVLATTVATEDLEDEVAEAYWSGSLGFVDLDDDAVAIRFVHAAPGAESLNSVQPSCVGVMGESGRILGGIAEDLAGAEESTTGEESEADATIVDDTAAEETDAVVAGPRLDDAEANESVDATENDAAATTADSATDDVTDEVDDPSTSDVNEIETEVLEDLLENMEEAPTAQAQPGMPSFTG